MLQICRKKRGHSQRGPPKGPEYGLQGNSGLGLGRIKKKRSGWRTGGLLVGYCGDMCGDVTATPCIQAIEPTEAYCRVAGMNLSSLCLLKRNYSTQELV